MRICFCSNRFPPKVVGGAELIAYDVACQLRDRGHAISVLTLSDTRISDTYAIDKMSVDCMPNFNLYNQFSLRKRSTPPR